MRCYDNGDLFTVTYNANDCQKFNSQWPCSTVKGKGSFQFDKRNGDLVDATGTALTGDGSEWLAFSQDCQAYGMKKLKL